MAWFRFISASEPDTFGPSRGCRWSSWNTQATAPPNRNCQGDPSHPQRGHVPIHHVGWQTGWPARCWQCTVNFRWWGAASESMTLWTGQIFCLSLFWWALPAFLHPAIDPKNTFVCNFLHYFTSRKVHIKFALENSPTFHHPLFFTHFVTWVTLPLTP